MQVDVDRLMSTNPETINEKRRILGVSWAKLDGEARRLDKMEGVVLAECYNFYKRDGCTVKDAEMMAKSDKRYKEAVESACKARTEANVKLAELKGYEMGFESWRSMNATRRMEMKL